MFTALSCSARKPQKDLNYYYNVDEVPVHMSDMDLYEKAFTLLHEDFDYIHDPEVMKRGIDNIRKQTMPYAIGNHLLALNMEDNDEPYRYLPEMMADMNKVCDDIEFVQESMDDYMDTIRKVMKPEDMYVHHGELRYTTMEYGNFNSLYGATHSSRIKLKNPQRQVRKLSCQSGRASRVLCLLLRQGISPHQHRPCMGISA